MQSLIDGDLVAYRCAASAENDHVDIARIRADKLMRDIIEKTSSSSFRCFLSGGENFRKKIDPLYKANRTAPAPKHLDALREFLVVEWNSEVTDGIEADDALGIAQVKFPISEDESKETIICSLDKDLLQIPGHHFSWEIGGIAHGKQWTKPDIFREVSYLDGLRNFYASTLIGDVSDNIAGVRGIGKVGAPKYFSDLEDEREMYETALALYVGAVERFSRNCKLLWIMREEGDIYDPVKRGLI